MVRNDYRGKSDFYGSWEIKRNTRLANPNYGKRSKGIFRVWKFLSMIYSTLFKYRKPLNDMMKKDQPFKWTMECQQAFEELKRCFTEEPVLMMPDQTKPF